MLAALRDFLAPGGSLCLEAPNLLSPHWGGIGILHIGHVDHFAVDTLGVAFVRAGFSAIKRFTDKHPVDPWGMTFLCRAAAPSMPSLLGSDDQAEPLLHSIIRKVAVAWTIRGNGSRAKTLFASD